MSAATEAAEALLAAAELIKEQDARYARLVDAFHQHRTLIHLQPEPPDAPVGRSVEHMYDLIREQQ